MLQFIPQSAKLCISFHNLTALCEQTSWLTHVANEHVVIDLLSWNAIFDHSQTSSFYSAMVDRAWFFAINKNKLPKCYVFSHGNTLVFSHENNAGVQIYRIREHFFLQTRDQKKKIVLNIEQWKNEGKVMWNLSEFVKTFMITQNKGEWPTCFSLASVTEQSSNKSSNQIYLSLVMILSLKINLWQFETGVREDLQRFLPYPNRKCTLIKVAES